MRKLPLILSCLVCAAIAFGQSDRGTITGTVADPAGAVVANAGIEARNLETGSVHRAASTETGNYTLPQLPAGTYEMTITVPGFKKFVRQNITVQVAQTLRVDASLEVGAATETVTVNAEVSLLQTESGELSHNVQAQRLNDLPLLGTGAQNAGSSGIRNPYAVAQMVPGTLWLPNNAVRVNGTPANSQSLRIEGQDATLGFANWAAQENQPSVDAIQEFAIQTSNYAAEYGQAGGALFNVTMRSGTNQFHGTGFDYFANEALNASTPFTNVKPRARRNDYGFTIGGPVWIPKIYNGHDKSFFFFNWEQFREKQILNNQTITVPTQAYRDGDFSQAITGNLCPAANPNCDPLGHQVLGGGVYDPKSGQLINGQVVRTQFQNNVIPKDRMDPVALAIQKMIPAAGNSAVANNLILPYDSIRVTSIPAIKADQFLSSRAKISFYFSKTGTESQYSPTLGQSEGLPTPITAARGTFIHSYTTRLNYDHTLSPTLLLHLGAGYVHNNFNDNAPVLDYDPAAGIGLKGAPVNSRFPTFLGLCPGAAPTFACAGTRGGMNNMGPNGQTTSLMIKPTFVASLTWVRNNHTYKAGAEARFEGYPNIGYTGTAGAFTFSPNQTAQPYIQSATFGGGTVGFPYASFLLGLVDQTQVNVVTQPRLGKQQWALFVQDTWKVTRKFTLDYGLRWDYGTYQKEQYGRMPTLSPTTPNPSAGNLPGAVIFEGSGPGHCNCSFAKNYPFAVGPRLGAAYQITPKTVFRAGIAVSYSTTPNNNQSTGMASTITTVTPPGFGDASTVLANGITAKPVWPDVRPGLYPQVLGTLAGPPVVIDQNAGRPARMLQWSVGVQRQIFANLAVEASYVGNRGAWWSGNNLVDYNAVTPERLRAAGLDLNSLDDRSLLTSTFASGRPQARGFQVPYAGFPLTQSLAQSLRPFPQFNTGLAPIWAPLGDTWYDALQAQVTKRFSHGLDVSYSFSWQKELTSGVEADPPGPGAPVPTTNDVFNRGNAKSLSGYSRPFSSGFHLTYNLPKWGKNKVFSYAVRDWQISTGFEDASGLPIKVPYATNNLQTVLPRTLPLGVTAPTYANRVAGQPLFSADLNCHCFDPRTTFVLNKNAWADPAAGQWGTSAAYYNDYRYQRRPSENFSFGRVFRFGEGKPSLLVRAEFSNIFNRTEPNNPTNTNPLGPQTRSNNSDPKSSTVSGFGFVNVGTVFAQPRQGQIVARFTF